MNTELLIRTAVTSTSAGVTFSQSIPTNDSVNVTPGAAAEPDAEQAEKIADALYGYLQAMRAMGRERVDAAEAARVLGVSVAQVLDAAGALKERGVEVL